VPVYRVGAASPREFASGVQAVRDDPGEIALLRGVPRAATVTATAPARLYALGREEFLSTVLGLPCAQREAERFATARLAHGAQLIPRAP
jgi:CRP-like cAMP-binding protein